MPNHILHTLTPLLLFTSFLLSLFTLLSPTPIFHDSVSLLSFRGNSSFASSASSAAVPTATSTHSSAPSATATSNSLLDPGRSNITVDMVRRMTKVRKQTQVQVVPLQKRASTTLFSDIFFGPMGACYTVNATSSDSDLTCTPPSFTPIFATIYLELSIPTSVSPLLPQQFPLAPTALFLSILLLATSFLGSLFSSLPLHSKKFAVLEKHRKVLVRIGVVAGLLGFVVELIATLALRIELGNVVDSYNGGQSDFSSASLGNGFNMLWAALSIGGAGLLASIYTLFRAT